MEESLGQRWLRPPHPRSQGDLVLDLRADMTGNVGLACVSLAHDCMRAWGSRDVAPFSDPPGFGGCGGRTSSGPTPTAVDTCVQYTVRIRCRTGCSRRVRDLEAGASLAFGLVGRREHKYKGREVTEAGRLVTCKTCEAFMPSTR